MPRRARMYLPELPYHIVQRGNNREACLIGPESYQFYLELWKEISKRYGVWVHSYCLMTNHIHFLVTPTTDTSISNTMKVVGSRYAQYINKKYGRTGTLWEGRHRSSLVQSEKYFLVCCRYIELNPVRSGMVGVPEEYQWSSYSSNAWSDDSWITRHTEYERLGETRDKQCDSYRELFKGHIEVRDRHLIRQATHYCQPVEDDRFRQEIENKYNIKIVQAKRGRPKKTKVGMVKL